MTSTKDELFLLNQFISRVGFEKILYHQSHHMTHHEIGLKFANIPRFLQKQDLTSRHILSGRVHTQLQTVPRLALANCM